MRRLFKSAGKRPDADVGAEPDRTQTDLTPIPDVQHRAGRQHRAFVVLMVVAATVLAAVVLVPIWKPIFVSATIAAAVYGAYRPLCLRLKGHRYLAAALVTLATVTLLMIPLTILIISGIWQISQALVWLKSILPSNGPLGLVERLPEWMMPLATSVLRTLPADLDAVAERLLSQGLEPLAAGLTSVTGFLLDFGLMIVALFFFLADGRRLIRWLSAHVPLTKTEQAEFLGAMKGMASTLLRANLGTGVIQAAVAAVGFLIVGTPVPVFFTIATFFASFIPAIGTGLVTLPVALGFLLVGKTWQGLLMLGWVFLVSMVDNVVRPYLARGRLKIHGGVVFFSFVGGIAVAGPVGLLLGPFAMAFLMTTLRVWKRNLS